MSLRYATGEEVCLGDIVDVGAANGPTARVVVIIPSGIAAPGFDAAAWSYLKTGVILEDSKTSALVRLSELNYEHVLVRRA